MRKITDADIKRAMTTCTAPGGCPQVAVVCETGGMRCHIHCSERGFDIAMVLLIERYRIHRENPNGDVQFENGVPVFKQRKG